MNCNEKCWFFDKIIKLCVYDDRSVNEEEECAFGEFPYCQKCGDDIVDEDGICLKCKHQNLKEEYGKLYKCETCGKELKHPIIPYDISNGIHIYCSRNCWGIDKEAENPCR